MSAHLLNELRKSDKIQGLPSILSLFCNDVTGLENSTRQLVFTSVSGCRASEYFDISTEN